MNEPLTDNAEDLYGPDAFEAKGRKYDPNHHMSFRRIGKPLKS